MGLQGYGGGYHPLDGAIHMAPERKNPITSEKVIGFNRVWRPQADLNRCRRRERAVSWARLDEGDV